MTTTQVPAHQELARELQDRISGDVRFDQYSRLFYSTDASLYEMEPVGVVLPRDEEDVISAIKMAGEHGVPLLPRGGGTSLAGQTVNHALVMDFSKYMSDLVELNVEEHWAWVQPGIIQNRLRTLVAPHGLNFGPDPATSNRGTIGGAIGNNSCGSHSVVYGKTLDHVMELEVVLADGTFTTLKSLTPDQLEVKLSLPGLEGDIYRGAFRIAREQRDEIDRRFPKISRRVSGYNLDEVLRDPANLARLAVGSEGTLLTVTRAKMNLVTRPKNTALAVLHFHDLIESMSATVELLKEPVTAIELMDKTIVEQGRIHPGFARRLAFVEGDPAALLVVEVAGESPRRPRARSGASWTGPGGPASATTPSPSPTRRSRPTSGPCERTAWASSPACGGSASPSPSSRTPPWRRRSSPSTSVASKSSCGRTAPPPPTTATPAWAASTSAP